MLIILSLQTFDIRNSDCFILECTATVQWPNVRDDTQNMHSKKVGNNSVLKSAILTKTIVQIICTIFTPCSSIPLVQVALLFKRLSSVDEMVNAKCAMLSYACI